MIINLLTYELLLRILIISASFFSVTSAYCFIANRYHVYKNNKIVRCKEILKNSIGKIIKSRDSRVDLSFLKKIKLAYLLPVLEEINNQNNSETWTAIKESISKEILLPQARKYCYSRNALKRHFACRIFYFFPLQEDEEFILHIIKDPFGINRYLLSKVAVTLGTVQSLEAVLDQMVKDKETFQFAYRDALRLRTDKAGLLLFQKLKLEERPLYRTRYLNTILRLDGKELLGEVKKDFESKDKMLKLSALRVLQKFYDPSFLSIIEKLLKDPDCEIRQQTVKCLANSTIDDKLTRLKVFLNDPDWNVRFTSAECICSFGDEGRSFLYQEKESNIRNVSEVCDYVLALYDYQSKLRG